MRETIKEIMKQIISIFLLQKREHLGLSQEKMAERLEMSRKGYTKLEYGISCCCAETFILILIFFVDNQTEFLNGIKAEFFERMRILMPQCSVSEIIEALSCRAPMKVTEIKLFKSDDAFPVCPKCGCLIEREYVNCCDVCGQVLSWKNFRMAKII